MNLHSLKKMLQRIFGLRVASFVFCTILFFTPFLESQLMAQNQSLESSTEIVEVIRLSVPKTSREAWLKAEMGSWEKWLVKKNGFLGRQLFWDPNSEESTLLITWSSREAWKHIPQYEVELVQEDFEGLARSYTRQLEGNPFPVVFEGEMLPQ